MGFSPASAMNDGTIWSASQPDGVIKAASFRIDGPSRPASSASHATAGISSGPIRLSASFASTSCGSNGTECDKGLDPTLAALVDLDPHEQSNCWLVVNAYFRSMAKA